MSKKFRDDRLKSATQSVISFILRFHLRVGYSQATKELKRLIAELGIKSNKVTDNSVKYLGVTKFMAAGMTLEDASGSQEYLFHAPPLQDKLGTVQERDCRTSSFL